MIYRFADFELDTRRFTLARAGQPVDLEPRALEMLLYLVERPHQLVTRDELVANVWKVRFVGKGLVSQYAYALRRALDDDPAKPRLLETVRGRGFRFLAGVESFTGEDTASHPASGGPQAQPPGRRGLVRSAVAATVVIAALAGATALLLAGAGNGNGSVAFLPLVNATGESELDWVELGLADMLARSLRRVRGMDVVPLAQVASAVKRTGGGGDDEAARRRQVRGLGARWVVSGSVSREGELYWVRGSLLGGDSEVALPVMAAGGSPLAAADGFARAIGERLGRGADVARMPAGIPADDEDTRRAWARGMHAQLSGHAREASRWFEVCLARRPELDWARYELALAKRKLGERDEARRLSQELVDSAEATGNTELGGAARAHLGILAWAAGELDSATSHLEQALATHRQLKLRRAEASTLVNLGIIATRQGRLDAAGALYERASKLFEELRDERGRAAVHNSLGVLAWNRGDLETSAAMHRRALELRRSYGDGAGEAASLNNLGTVALARGEFEDAEALFSQAVELRRALADREGIASSKANLANVAIERGYLRTAEESLRQVREVAAAIPSPEKESAALAGLGTVAALRKDWDTAAALARQRLALERARGGRMGQAEALAALVVAEARGGQLAAAREALASLNALAGDSGDPSLMMARSTARGAVATASGSPSVAEHELKRALTVAREAGHGRWQLSVVVQLGELLLAQGRIGEAESLIASLPPAWRNSPRLGTLSYRLLQARGDARGAQSVAARGRDEAPELWARDLAGAADPVGSR